KPLYISADPDGWITGYFDTPLPDTPYVSGGIYALPASALDVLDDCMAAGMVRMRDFQRALVASGMRLRAWPFSRIIDVDHADDITKALGLIDNSNYSNY
ncbi:MAG: NDP-sugar synthase, partial [Duncaniella sp.]|nr:NDP-sugar synthase [Duncaniella sp.]